MTPKHTPGHGFALESARVDVSERADELGPAAPTPRAPFKARVPPINDPQPLSSQISEHRAHRATQINTLLHHYRDVLEGIPDREYRGSDDLLALMCPAWNHRSYQQLERLLRELKGHSPVLHAKLVTRFLRYSERRVAWCKKCGEHPASEAGKVHAHPPGRSVSLKPKVVRVPPRNDDPAGVAEALRWLEEHWVGRVDLPRSVFEIEAERKLRGVAA